jgi:hypothetical protein
MNPEKEAEIIHDAMAHAATRSAVDRNSNAFHFDSIGFDCRSEK